MLPVFPRTRPREWTSLQIHAKVKSFDERNCKEPKKDLPSFRILTVAIYDPIIRIIIHKSGFHGSRARFAMLHLKKPQHFWNIPLDREDKSEDVWSSCISPYFVKANRGTSPQTLRAHRQAWWCRGDDLGLFRRHESRVSLRSLWQP